MVAFIYSPHSMNYRHSNHSSELSTRYPGNIYLFKVNNRDTRKKCEICSKLTIKIMEQRHWLRSGVFIVDFEHTSHLFLVSLLLNLNK